MVSRAHSDSVADSIATAESSMVSRVYSVADSVADGMDTAEDSIVSQVYSSIMHSSRAESVASADGSIAESFEEHSTKRVATRYGMVAASINGRLHPQDRRKCSR